MAVAVTVAVAVADEIFQQYHLMRFLGAHQLLCGSIEDNRTGGQR
jgi:hypothetical protein